MTRRRCMGLLFSAASLKAGDGFNGRWDITVEGEPRRRAWWLEVEGAGTSNPRGKFVSAYAGDLNPIEEIEIRGNELIFGWRRPDRGHLIYRARLEGERLIGTFEIEGEGRPRLRWTGVRAPHIPDKDDGSWKPAKPVDLFNGKNLDGWKPVVPDQALGWMVRDGLLTNSPKANNLISEQTFWNFELHAEVRLGPKSNSGIGLRARYEVQILDDYGRAPDTHSNGALYSRIAPSLNASLPPGHWQSYDIRLVGRQVTVVLNGKKIIDKREIEGLTAAAVDANEAEPGPFLLQGDHGSIEIRRFVVTPLIR